MNNPQGSRAAFSPVVTSSEWSQCEEQIKAFEAAWRLGMPPSIRDHLSVDPGLRTPLLIELVHVDLELRLKAGDAVRLESYLESFPELTSDRPAVIELLAAELALRRRYEGPVEPAEYAERFPDLRETLIKKLSSVHETTQLAPPASAPARENPPPDVPGYEILEQVGRGGMGIVYKARDPHLDRHVALKFLPPEYAASPDRLERFLREARTASGLNHPHICTVHALDTHADRPFIVMEYVEGRTLAAFASERTSVAGVVVWLSQAAQALAAAHAAGVVHRDIKPENIMVRDDGYVKVLDFGLARQLPTLLSSRPDAAPPTDAGTLLGTVAYMSPEQTRGAPAESASDIFSLGIVAYQLLTGRHPFEGDTPLATLGAIATSTAVPPSRLNGEVPVALSGLIEAMLHKEPHLRPTAAEVEATLDGLQTAAAPRRSDAVVRPIVRREAELLALRDALTQAEAGRGSFVCISGEPGIGKTTLVEGFLAELASEDSRYLVARGNCSERLADTEAYLPVMDALENLLRTDGNGSAARLMRIVAPTWYSQIAPASDEAASDTGGTSRASSQQAMLREFCNFLQECSRLGTVVLFFDDLHWADVSTVDLLAHLGRNCQELRTFVVATYRPTEMLLGPHPFHGVKLELVARGVCCDLGLKFLGRGEVARYLDLAFPNHAFGDAFADLIHARTEGSPLFMADLLRYLRERGFLAEIDGTWTVAQELPDLSRELPESVRGMIQRKLERLERSDRQLLSAASVQGNEFDSQIVADALGRDSADVEERLDELARVHALLRAVRASDLPDGSLSMRCSFVHILYQQALYHDLLPTRRAALSLALARALERRYGESNPAVAAELACLYEEGRDYLQSARQFWVASQNAAQVFAHGEAVALARRGIKLLQSLPASPQRSELELQLQTTLGLQLQVTEGFGAASAQEAYARARQICLRSPEGPPLFPVLWGLWLYYKVRSELMTAQHFAADLARLARSLNDPDLSLQAHQALAMTAFCRGQHEAAQQHVEQAVALYDRRRHVSHSFQFGQDPSVICKAFGADVLWLLGYPNAAARQSEDAIRMSESLSPSSQAVALYFAATVYQLQREPAKALSCAEECLAVASEHGYSFWITAGGILRGWAVAASGSPDEGIEAMRRGIETWRGIGSETYRTYFLGILADMLSRRGDLDEAGRLVDEALALAVRTDEGFYQPELHRLKGELLVAESPAEGSPPLAAAREQLERAFALAQNQGARSLELRAAMSLARHSRRLGNPAEARERLAASYHWFTDGFQTPDLKDAVQLLAGPLWDSL